MAEGASKAGDVFKEVYDLAVNHMHPEDALSIAESAAMNYLEHIGAARPVVSTTQYEGMSVRVMNVEEIKKALTAGVLEGLASDAGAQIIDDHLSEGIAFSRDLSTGTT